MGGTKSLLISLVGVAIALAVSSMSIFTFVARNWMPRPIGEAPAPATPDTSAEALVIPPTGARAGRAKPRAFGRRLSGGRMMERTEGGRGRGTSRRAAALLASALQRQLQARAAKERAALVSGVTEKPSGGAEGGTAEPAPATRASEAGWDESHDEAEDYSEEPPRGEGQPGWSPQENDDAGRCRHDPEQDESSEAARRPPIWLFPSSEPKRTSNHAKEDAVENGGRGEAGEGGRKACEAWGISRRMSPDLPRRSCSGALSPPGSCP